MSTWRCSRVSEYGRWRVGREIKGDKGEEICTVECHRAGQSVHWRVKGQVAGQLTRVSRPHYL